MAPTWLSTVFTLQQRGSGGGGVSFGDSHDFWVFKSEAMQELAFSEKEVKPRKNSKSPSP